MNRPLPVLQPHEVTDRTSLFRCDAYSATLMAGACATRQANAGRVTTGADAVRYGSIDHLRRCLNCEDGRKVVEKIGKAEPTERTFKGRVKAPKPPKAPKERAVKSPPKPPKPPKARTPEYVAPEQRLDVIEPEPTALQQAVERVSTALAAAPLTPAERRAKFREELREAGKPPPREKRPKRFRRFVELPSSDTPAQGRTCGLCGELGHDRRVCPKKSTAAEVVAAINRPTLPSEPGPLPRPARAPTIGMPPPTPRSREDEPLATERDPAPISAVTEWRAKGALLLTELEDRKATLTEQLDAVETAIHELRHPAFTSSASPPFAVGDIVLCGSKNRRYRITHVERRKAFHCGWGVRAEAVKVGEGINFRGTVSAGRFRKA